MKVNNKMYRCIDKLNYSSEKICLSPTKCLPLQSIMQKKDNTPKTREEIFAEKADNYPVCFSEKCPLREHCLHSILASYTPKDRIYITCVNLLNPQTQGEDCPQYRKDEPVRMPIGLSTIYYDMPSRIERAIKNHLINVYSRKRYYEYHNGTRPMTPDVERYVRQTIKNFGWPQEPNFAGYVEEYLW